jgi:hypothetical protein
MKTQEESIREALGEIQNEATRAGKFGCPPEEVLALYVEGRLDEQEKTKVSEHLSLCSGCLDTVLLESRLVDKTSVAEEPANIRFEALQRAKDLVGPGLDKILFDLVVRVYRGAMEVVHSTLTPVPLVYQHVAAAVRRGPEEREEPQPLRMEKSFGDISAEIEVTSPKEGRWNIQILLRGPEGGEDPKGIRITLKDLSQEKELQSSVVRSGLAAFPDLSAGDYVLEIKEKGRVIGEFSLRLFEDDQKHWSDL